MGVFLTSYNARLSLLHTMIIIRSCTTVLCSKLSLSTCSTWVCLYLWAWNKSWSCEHNSYRYSLNWEKVLSTASMFVPWMIKSDKFSMFWFLSDVGFEIPDKFVVGYALVSIDIGDFVWLKACSNGFNFFLTFLSTLEFVEWMLSPFEQVSDWKKSKTCHWQMEVESSSSLIKRLPNICMTAPLFSKKLGHVETLWILHPSFVRLFALHLFDKVNKQN